MTLIGLTGGIASGKSTAAEILAELGATIIDADRLGHRSYEPGTPGFQKVVNAFGHDIVGADGTIDRRILGGKVFGAPGQLERLNAIVWPEIRSLIKSEAKQIRAQEDDPIIVLEAAVLLEAGWQDLCDEVWVVITPVKTAVARLKDRNGMTEDAAMARIDAQMSNKERAAASDVKIENNGTEEQLRARVERAWKSLQTRRRRAAKAKAAEESDEKATKTGIRKASASGGSSKAAARSTTGRTTTKAAAPKARKATTKASTTTTKATGAKTSARSSSTGKSSAGRSGEGNTSASRSASSRSRTKASKPARSAGTTGTAARKPAGGRSAARTGARTK